MPPNYITISIEEAKRFGKDCLVSVGVKEDHATPLIDVLVDADVKGHFSHGLSRLTMYIDDVKSGKVNTKGQPELIKETPATAYVSGNNCLGPVVGEFCMKIAITKAKRSGVGWVVAKESNHYGISQYYVNKAVSEGLIGFAFTNSSPLVIPTRSKVRALGTNPICIGAPASNRNNDFILDMSTSAVALGRLEICQRQNQPIPSMWAADINGKPTTDANAGMDGGLLPLGGVEDSGGYKGYGLAMAVDVLCGICAGSAYGSKVRRWMQRDRVADLGQCFMVVNPETFAQGFGDRMDSFANEMRNLPRSDEKFPVLIPGDPERASVVQCNFLNGVPYMKPLINSFNDLAKTLGVQPIQTKMQKKRSIKL